MKTILRSALSLAPFLVFASALEALPQSPAERARTRAERALAAGNHDEARDAVDRALERDPKAIETWDLRARLAEATDDRDLLVYCLHRKLQLATSQKRPQEERDALRARLDEVDPGATQLLGLKDVFVQRLLPIAERYEEAGRPHSAIRVHREILALDPERTASDEAIQRLAANGDPSLAEDARPRDLLEDVTDEWIAEQDAEHAAWKDRYKLKTEHYHVQTNAGYEVLVTLAEAMEQMNAFYRQFFQHTKAVPRIDLNIFNTREEYLKHGQGPPVEWSGGHFTGSAVETWSGGDNLGTLFHEAAHQFVNLSTTAGGWLNEGLASFFEGTELLSNGTVRMNLPANHRLFPLVSRMEKGWMASHDEGLEENPNAIPARAPTFRFVIENKYEWGPPWYAPTWGLVYFLYNYQDPSDGRYVYRKSFLDFLNRSGGRVGQGAVKNFEEVVLANPAAPTRGASVTVPLPRTIDEVDQVWKDWLFNLRDVQVGRVEEEFPYHDWALSAIERGDLYDAFEFFEKGLREDPDDADLLADFADYLAEAREDADRASKLLRRAMSLLRALDEVDEDRVSAMDRKIRKLDEEHEALDEIRADLVAAYTGLVRGYLGDGLDMMAMDVAWRTGNDFEIPAMFEYFEEGMRRSGRSLGIWKLAYNEHDLQGWHASQEKVFRAAGEFLESKYGEYAPDDYEFRFLTLNTTTSGDFSLEADVYAEHGEVNFGGIVFGQKTGTDFQSVLFLPPRSKAEGVATSGYVDLATFFGNDEFKTWAHVPVADPRAGGDSVAASYRIRVDVTGRNVDVWCNGEFVTTKEYPNLGVLRGYFGLLVGKGTMRFRNIRYLARHARDEGARIEREVKLEAYAPAGESRGGSWLGMKPPFPQVQEWAQGERKSWQEAGLAPQLLVLWSINQNELVPLDGWLRKLADDYADYGLQFVCIAEGWDGDRMKDYLAEHPFPGVVGIDEVIAENTGYTHDQYAIKRFNLPRVLLIDVNHEVAWEGDPGFRVGEDWDPSVESYLKDPLDELLERRQLKEVAAWRDRWNVEALPALSAGDVPAALSALLESREFDWKIHDDVMEAQARLTTLENAAGSIEACADELIERGCEPALEVLLDWADLVGVKIPGKTEKQLKKHLKGGNHSAWKKALKAVGPLPKKVKGGKGAEDVQEVIAELRDLEGTLPSLLADRMQAALEDEEALLALVEGAERLPADWLANDYFGW